MEQIAQEGAIQIFKTPYTGMEEVIVGVVGTLQFDVLEYRLKNEYGVEPVSYTHLGISPISSRKMVPPSACSK